MLSWFDYYFFQFFFSRVAVMVISSFLLLNHGVVEDNTANPCLCSHGLLTKRKIQINMKKNTTKITLMDKSNSDKSSV